MKSKKTVFLTGATGTMGHAGLVELSKRLDRFNITLLARPSKINKEKLATYEAVRTDGTDKVPLALSYVYPFTFTSTLSGSS